MAESTLDVRHLPKAQGYALLESQLISVLDGVTDEVTIMATVSCGLFHGFGLLWAGYYRVVSPGLLRVGPYQGTLGCLEIPFGKGVCGAAAAQATTVIVPDVHAFPGHIACDGRSRSEIVVPIFDGEGRLTAVLDLDSEALGTFDRVDAASLERLLARLHGTPRK
ncbi:hypothetical protein LBMAG42_53770 [Deltaproteobacteria bacterium]|nr:hypothetical protein LBMAG42_53770 [Deltaproteobacteria bacterium]